MKPLIKPNLRLNSRSSLILAIAAVGGVIATAVSAAVVTPKAVKLIEEDSKEKHDGDAHASTKKEAFLVAWKCYIPTAVIGLSTIGCILGANWLSAKQQAALTSAYALVKNSYKQYQSKVKELYGEETHNKIIDSMMVEKPKDIPITTHDFWGCSWSLDFGDYATPEVKRTFYDACSERYFESTIERVIQAEYHLNHEFMIAGAVPLNLYFEFLGLDKTDYGDVVGWSSMNGDIYWVEFSHGLMTLDDGMEICVINMVYYPEADWDKDL